MFYLFPKKRKSQTKLFAGLLLLTVTGALIKLIGDYSFSRPAPLTYATETSPALPAEVPENPDIIKTGKMRIECFYSCGHSEIKETDIPDGYIGLSPDELMKKDPGIIRCSYKNGILDIKKNVSLKCPHHYSVRLEGSSIIVLNENSPETSREEIPVDLRGLYEDEIDALQKGLEFSTKEEVLEFLEDFAS